MTARAWDDVFWDGRILAITEGEGRRFGVDPRCLAGTPVTGGWAHVCASPDSDARIPFDAPEVQHARREALAWWISLLGDRMICLSTLSLDASHYGGAITVARTPDFFASDPFSRLFAGTVVRSDVFSVVVPPPGPVIERYTGAPWPAGAFGA